MGTGSVGKINYFSLHFILKDNLKASSRSADAVLRTHGKNKTGMIWKERPL